MINLQRGLLRTWLVVSLIWFVGVLGFAASDRSIPSLIRDCSELRGFVLEETGQPLGDDEVTQCEASWRTEREQLLAVFFGPPVGLLVLGFAVVWAGLGFRTEKSN